MRLGCHAVLFGDQVSTHTQDVLSRLASTGFEGVEMGSRFFGMERQAELAGALKTAGIALSALHMNIPTTMWVEEPARARDIVRQVAGFAKGIPCTDLLMSGSPCSGLTAAARNMDIAARECRELGVALNYHNHREEFDNDGEMYHALREHAPNLYFGFDLGWICKSGYDIQRILAENSGRVRYVHLRDCGDDLAGREFPDLGQGKEDLQALVVSLAHNLPEDGWAVVEYETGDQDYGRYEKAHRLLEEILQREGL